MTTDKNKRGVYFAVRFLLLFFIFYFGTLFMIGLAAPGGWYSPFVQQYLDYVSWLKSLYMKGASVIAGFFGYATHNEPGFLVRVTGGRGVVIAYDCVGYGVMSFWAAYALSVAVPLKWKVISLFSGLLLLFLINTVRIGLFLVAINKGWPMPLGIDHHTWFNIVAYGFIFAMMFFVQKINSHD